MMKTVMRENNDNFQDFKKVSVPPDLGLNNKKKLFFSLDLKGPRYQGDIMGVFIEDETLLLGPGSIVQEGSCYIPRDGYFLSEDFGLSWKMILHGVDWAVTLLYRQVIVAISMHKDRALVSYDRGTSWVEIISDAAPAMTGHLTRLEDATRLADGVLTVRQAQQDDGNMSTVLVKYTVKDTAPKEGETLDTCDHGLIEFDLTVN